MKYEIRHEIGIKGTPNAVFQALTSAQKLSQWWSPNTRGTSKIGNSLEFWFDDFCQVFEIKSLKKDQQVVWKGTKKGLDEWVGTEVSFKLKQEGPQVWVYFSHTKWKSNRGMLPHCSTKWAVFLLSLKSLIETGKGRPFPKDTIINYDEELAR